MRKLTYYVACTVDRFIAREDGRFDFFLTEGEHFAHLLSEFPETIPGHLSEALGVQSGNKWFDTVLMGRRTYEVGLEIGVTNPYPRLKQYVFSRSMSKSPDHNVQLITGDSLDIVHKLKQEDGLDIWLCGGAELAATLFPEIDEIILKVNPVLLGSGIPLFKKIEEPINLDLIDNKVFNNGLMISHYRVGR